MRRVLGALDESGATIGILPEAALSNELLHVWQDELKATPADWDCPLQWILVGTGPVGGNEPPFNRAVMLLRDEGHEILTYDKHFDFTLSPSQVKDWKLERYLGPGRACEDIHPGNRVLVRESALGRFGVLICEDVTRLTEAGAALGHFGVSHVFVPIFSPPVSEETWESWAARDVVRHLGATIVVVNSLAVGRAIRPQGGELGTCSTATPPANTRDEWQRFTVQVQETADPEEVKKLAVPGAHIKRFTGR